MRLREFGPLGVSVPVIGQGTWKMESSRRKSIDALRRGFDLGMTHVDTAEMYGSGKVEELVGEAISGWRDEIFLVSKVLPTNATRAGTVRACERSLERLKTDRLDCYLLHWAGRHPLEETIAGFEELKSAGKILSYGVSNFDVAQMKKAVAIAGENGIACNQVEYHLKSREIETDVFPFCRENRVAMVGYSPFGHAHGGFPKRKSALDDVAGARGMTTRQVALSFLVRFDHSFGIPKSSSIEHVEENAAAASIELTDDEIAAISDAFPI